MKTANHPLMMAALACTTAALGFGAGLASASSNDDAVAVGAGDANLRLAKGNEILASVDASTDPPSACVSKQLTPSACNAVRQLDRAHNHGLTALARVDATEQGQGAAPLQRRLERVATTATYNGGLFAGIISPEFAGIISPEFAGIISPEFAGIISPELAQDLDDVAGIISPEVAGIISPERTAALSGIISPEYAGIISPERERIEAEIAAIVLRAESDLVLAYAMQRALDQTQ